MGDSDQHEFDAIVIGGGPAGSAFAITAARAGLRVILLEQDKQPLHRVCGEFLSAETQVMLKDLGVNLDGLNAPSQSMFRLVNRDQYLDINLPFTGRSQSRLILDELLLRESSRCGVCVQRGAKVKHLSTDSDVPTATVIISGGTKITAPLAVIATGASTVRGINGRELSDLVGYKILLSLNSDATADMRDRVQLMGYDGGYQGMLLVEGQMASLAWIMGSDQAKTLGNDWELHQGFLSRQSEFVGDMLSGSWTDWKSPLAVSGLQFGFLRKNLIENNVFPVGRQMAIIPSFTGDGLAIALATGIYAAQAVRAGRSAAVYQKQMRDLLRHQFRWARMVHPMLLRGWTRTAGLAVARRIPGIVGMVTNATRLRDLPKPMPYDLPV